MQLGSAVAFSGPKAEPRVGVSWLGRVFTLQPLRYLVVGFSATTVNGVSRLLLSLVLGFEVSVVLAYAIGMVVGFLAYRHWVFCGSRIPLPRQLLFFILVNAAGLFVVMLVARAVLSLVLIAHPLPLGRAESIAHGTALVAAALVNFVGHRSLSFARGPSTGPAIGDA